MNQIKHIFQLSELNHKGESSWGPDKIALQYQVPVRHIHKVLRNKIPDFETVEQEKKFNEISQKNFIQTSRHQNVTNVFSQFTVKKAIKNRGQHDGKLPTPDQQQIEEREKKEFNFSNV